MDLPVLNRPPVTRYNRGSLWRSVTYMRRSQNRDRPRRLLPRTLLAICLAIIAVRVARTAQIIPKAPGAFPAPPSGQAGCSLETTCAELAPGMIKDALGSSALEKNLRELTVSIGGRVSGSSANQRAVLWAETAFDAAGIADVKTESFTLPEGWNEGATSARVIAPERFALRLVSTGWSPPLASTEARLVDVGFGDEAGFAKAADLPNSIVLVHKNLVKTPEDLLSANRNDPAVVDRARTAHALAIFWMSEQPGAVLYRQTSRPGGGVPERLPQAVVARDDAERLARLVAASKAVRVHFEMPNHFTGPKPVKNVVAEVRGWDQPTQFVVLAAHLDSWDLGEGALDNGCNAAMLIDAARVIHASGSTPRRSIRFILFNAEEQGMVGSRAYVQAHRSELDKAISAIVFDSGSGAVTGYSVAGRSELIPALRQVLDPLKPLGVGDFTDHAAIETDNFDFILEGIPTLTAKQDPANYLANYHAATDTFDKVDIANLKRQSAIAAITAYAIADAPQRIGTRQSRADIDRLLKATGLDTEMKLEGFWPAWVSGERGRLPDALH